MHPTITVTIDRLIALSPRLKFLTTRIAFAGEFTFAVSEFFHFHTESAYHKPFTLSSRAILTEVSY